MRSIRCLLLVAVLCAAASPALAQTNLTSTTAAAAVTNTTTTIIPVASATGIVARTTGLFVPVTGEWMLVTAVNGTNISVTRGQGPMGAWPIANAALLVITPVQAAILVNRQGSCAAPNVPQYFQYVNIATGDLNVCLLTTTLWQQRNNIPVTQPTTVVLTR